MSFSPFDHSPVGNQKLLEEGYVLVFPNYIGTRGSDGVCTFDNAIETIEIVINFIVSGSGYNSRNDKINTWSVSEVSIIGASYGASVALCVGAINKSIKKIIACSPVSDRKSQGGLSETSDFLAKSYNNLWRVIPSDLERFSQGEIKVNPVEYTTELSEKHVMIIHDLNDPQIPFDGVKRFFQTIQNNYCMLFTQNNSRHILLHHLDEDEIYKNITLFFGVL